MTDVAPARPSSLRARWLAWRRRRALDRLTEHMHDDWSRAIEKGSCNDWCGPGTHHMPPCDKGRYQT